jgi:hypothetical protein
MLEENPNLDDIELLEDRKPVDLTPHQLDMLAGLISTKHDDWRDARREHLDEIKKIRNYIYQSQKGEQNEGDPYTLPAIYKLNETIISLVKENVYTTNAGIFDVKGDDEISQESANLWKWDIVNDLEKINFKSEKAKAFLKSFNESGEIIVLVGLQTKTVKRKKEIEVPQVEIGLSGEEIQTSVIKVGLVDIETYDGIEVFPIKSEDFLFDTTKQDRFDSPVCGKIIKKWLSYDEIISNKAYDLLSKTGYGKEVKEYLKQSIKDQQPSFDTLREDTSIDDTNRIMFDGDQAEVLDFRGNISVDGKDLKNYLITLAGNRVIRCEPDPYYNSTIVHYAHAIHPDYKRGISPLRVALKSADITSNIVNEIVTAFPYIANPVDYVPQGAIVNKKERPKPGGHIEYNLDLNKQPPFPKDVSGVLKGFELIEFFSRQTEGAAGVSTAMMGQPTEEKKTATEVKAMQVGGSIRISELIDEIKQFNIAVIQKIADIKVNFEEGDKQIGVQKGDGGIKQETVTDQIRNGKYHYTYIDSKATMERQAQFKDVLKLLELIFKVSPYIVDVKEVFKYGLLETGMQDVEKFLTKDKLDEGISQILKQMGMEANPKTMEMAKMKIMERLPDIARVIIQDGQQSNIEQSLSQQGMGGMPTNPQRGGLPPRGMP